MTKPSGQAKPRKPSRSYPLTAHACGQWCKKIGGRRYYFGPWDDPNSALVRYQNEFPYLQAGIEPPRDSLTLRELLNAFDDDKTATLEAGRISKRTYDEYMAVCTVIADVLGNLATAYSVEIRVGIWRESREVTMTRRTLRTPTWLPSVSGQLAWLSPCI